MSFRPSYVQEQLKGSSEYKRRPSRPKTLPPAKFTRDHNYIEILRPLMPFTGELSPYFHCKVHTDYGTYTAFKSEDYYECWKWRENQEK